MKKFVLFSSLFLIFTSLNADYLYGKTDRCISDYWFSGGSFYYVYSYNNTQHTTTSNNYIKYIHDGYKYDLDNNICKKDQNLGLTPSQYNFLYGLVGLIFGFLFFWMVPKR
jgi:hypothetical protein